MAGELEEEHHDDLHDVCEGKERISRFLNAKLIGSACVSDEEDEEEIEADIPIEVLEISWVLEEILTDKRTRVLDERIDSHYVE